MGTKKVQMEKANENVGILLQISVCKWEEMDGVSLY